MYFVRKVTTSHFLGDSEPKFKRGFFDKIDLKARTAQQESNGNIWQQWVNTQSDILPDRLLIVYQYYNTTLPSSAPVERLFSLSKRVLAPTRTLLSDENFKMMVLVAANTKSS